MGFLSLASHRQELGFFCKSLRCRSVVVPAPLLHSALILTKISPANRLFCFTQWYMRCSISGTRTQAAQPPGAYAANL